MTLDYENSMLKGVTLFPDRVLPVMSSRLIDTENWVGMPGRFHLCMGVLGFANWNSQNINN